MTDRHIIHDDRTVCVGAWGGGLNGRRAVGGKPTSRQPGTPRFKCSPAQCRKGLHGRQRNQQGQGRLRRIDLSLFDQQAHTQQDQGQREAAGHAVNGSRFGIQSLQATVAVRQTFIRAAQGLTLGGQPTGHEQFRLARYQIHGLGTEPFREQGPPCGGAPRVAGQHDGHGQADDQHPAAQCKAKPGRHHADHHRGQQRRAQRRGGRHQQAKIEGVQRIQVRGQPE